MHSLRLTCFAAAACKFAFGSEVDAGSSSRMGARNGLMPCSAQPRGASSGASCNSPQLSIPRRRIPPLPFCFIQAMARATLGTWLHRRVALHRTMLAQTRTIPQHLGITTAPTYPASIRCPFCTANAAANVFSVGRAWPFHEGMGVSLMRSQKKLKRQHSTARGENTLIVDCGKTLAPAVDGIISAHGLSRTCWRDKYLTHRALKRKPLKT